MTIEIKGLRNSTTTSGALIAVTLIGVATSLPMQASDNFNKIKPNYPDYENHLRHRELKLRGFDNSGGEVLKTNDTEQFANLFSFASKLINESNQPPREFEKTFKKRLRDILA